MTSLNPFIELRNTNRIKRTLNKLKNNEPVSIVFLGGSITSGFSVPPEKCFSALFEQWLKKSYPGCTLSIHNLGIPGTPSVFGLYECIRYAGFYEPDLIFIEYAINDIKNFEHQAAFESMVFHALNMNREPAVFLLLAKSKVGYTCQNFMDMVAEHYHQTSVFIGNAVDELSWDEYSDDYGHPNIFGHQYIERLLETAVQMAEDAPLVNEPIPKAPFFNHSLSKLTFTNERWNYQADNRNCSIEFSFSCRYLYILYFSSGNDIYGDAELTIDGKKHSVISGFQIGGWDRLIGHIIQLSDETRPHTISLCMQKGEEAKLFSLQNIGYC